MALKSCRECGKEVSDSAEKCPHCGVGSPAKSRSARGAGCVVAVLVLGAIGYCFATSMDTVSTALQPKPFTLTIACTPRMEFSGSYLTLDAKGASTSHDILGPCPASGRVVLTGEANTVSAQAQKKGEQGSLRMTLRVGDRAPIVSETVQPYGIVTAAQ